MCAMLLLLVFSSAGISWQIEPSPASHLCQMDTEMRVTDFGIVLDKAHSFFNIRFPQEVLDGAHRLTLYLPPAHGTCIAWFDGEEIQCREEQRT